MFEPALSSCAKELNEVMFKSFKKAGIYTMEVSLSSVSEQSKVNLKDVKRLADKYEIKLWTGHLPFNPFSQIDISNPEISEYAVSYFSDIIKLYADIGVNKVVIHPSGEPIDEKDRGIRMECAKKSLKKLADFAGDLGSVIAVENLPRTCLGRDSKEITELISADERLKVCFDTNHLLKENLLDFINAVGDKIITLHVSDYDFIDEKHWLPGEGKINWQELVFALKEVNYSGPWLYEVAFETPRTIERTRNLNCEDVVNNANAVLSNREIPKII